MLLSWFFRETISIKHACLINEYILMCACFCLFVCVHTCARVFVQTHAKSLTSIPSLFMIALSIFKMAVLMVRGGGSTVIPMLIALDRFGSSTVISLVLLSCFCRENNPRKQLEPIYIIYRSDANTGGLPTHTRLVSSSCFTSSWTKKFQSNLYITTTLEIWKATQQGKRYFIQVVSDTGVN